MRPPVNAVRLTLHPAGMAPRIVNYGAWRAHMLSVLRQQIDARGDRGSAGPVRRGLGLSGAARKRASGELRCGRAAGDAASHRDAAWRHVLPRHGYCFRHSERRDPLRTRAGDAVSRRRARPRGSPKPWSRSRRGRREAGRARSGDWLPPLAPCRVMVHIGGGRLAKDVPLANRVRSGRKQP